MYQPRDYRGRFVSTRDSGTGLTNKEWGRFLSVFGLTIAAVVVLPVLGCLGCCGLTLFVPVPPQNKGQPAEQAQKDGVVRVVDDFPRQPPKKEPEAKPARTRGELRVLLMGRTREGVVEVLGEPPTKANVRGIEVWSYPRVACEREGGPADPLTRMRFDKDGRVSEVLP